MFPFPLLLLLRDGAGRVSPARSTSTIGARLVRLLGVLTLIACAALPASPAFGQTPSEEDEEGVEGVRDRDPDAEEDEEGEEEEGRQRGARARAAAERAPDIQFAVTLRVPLGSSASATPAVLGDLAFVPLREGRLAAVDLATGRTRWAVEIATGHAPAAGDGMVFVAAGDRLAAIDLGGEIRWSVAVRGGFSAPPLWDTGWLLAPTAEGEVLCLRARDGQVLWTRGVGSPAAARPAIAGDRAYVSLTDGRLLALELRTGTPIWEQQLAGAGAEPLPLEERLFVGSTEWRFYSLSTATGERHWVWKSMGGAVRAAPTIDTRHVYFTAMDNVLRALDRFNGSQRWKAGLPFRPFGPPLLVGDLVFVTGIGPETRAYRAADGRVAAEFTGASDLAAPPRLVPHPIPDFTRIVLVTRTSELLLIERASDVPIVPLTQPIGAPAPVTPPPGFAG